MTASRRLQDRRRGEGLRWHNGATLGNGKMARGGGAVIEVSRANLTALRFGGSLIDSSRTTPTRDIRL